MIKEALNVGIPVMINIPTQAAFVKNASAKRQYNHKVARITEVAEDKKCRINLDDGYFYWEAEILCPLTQKKCKCNEKGEQNGEEKSGT